ncbi:MAG: hypothetical protein LC720_05585 [Actinobacteria bacterium]|nr:hypothetical protein [Actinomycetota bacterium]
MPRLGVIADHTVCMRTGQFYLPPEKLTGSPEVRFNELGFGSTHGYIAAPASRA